MSTLPLILFSVAAVASYALLPKKPSTDDLPPPSTPTMPQKPTALPITRSRSIQNELTLWNDAWELNPARGRIRFRVRHCQSGLIIALANEWKKAAAGGIAVVLREPLSAPIQNSENAVFARNRSYFATMPYFNRPSFQSTNCLNHEIRPFTVLRNLVERKINTFRP